MKRDRRAASIGMPELLVRTSLTDFDEAAPLKEGDNLSRLENRDGGHLYAT